MSHPRPPGYYAAYPYEAEAEIAKLRTALEEIIECYDPIDGMGRVQMTIARDALKTKTST
jgi:hypothetical protein